MKLFCYEIAFTKQNLQLRGGVKKSINTQPALNQWILYSLAEHSRHITLYVMFDVSVTTYKGISVSNVFPGVERRRWTVAYAIGEDHRPARLSSQCPNVHWERAKDSRWFWKTSYRLFTARKNETWSMQFHMNMVYIFIKSIT